MVPRPEPRKPRRLKEKTNAGTSHALEVDCTCGNRIRRCPCRRTISGQVHELEGPTEGHLPRAVAGDHARLRVRSERSVPPLSRGKPGRHSPISLPPRRHSPHKNPPAHI